jgi:hydrogenase/urease accessory protein HupE
MGARGLRGALLALIVSVGAHVQAHPLAPSLLELLEPAPGELHVRWKIPSRQPRGAVLTPRLPDGCVRIGPSEWTQEESAVVERFEAHCGTSLAGARVAVDGLGATRTDALVRIRLFDGRSFTRVLTGAEPGFAIPERESRAAVLGSYLRLGALHILSGADHLAFVLGLLLLVPSRRGLIATVTAFTLGHSATLSLAVLGWIAVPTAPLEVLIAASLVALAFEAVRSRGGAPRVSWGLAAGFGLLHGLGFAGALHQAGLPAGAIPLALLSFNLGIELGQLGFIAAVLAVAALVTAWIRDGAERALPYAIGSFGCYLVLDRLFPVG